MGAYPPPPGHSPLPGLEIAGEVAAVGAGRHALEGGRQGVRAGERRRLRAILPSPRRRRRCRSRPGLDMVQAAAVPETFFTVWNNVFERGGLQGRRMVPGARRHQRHRHHRHPARQGVRRQGARDGGLGREVQGLRRPRRRPRHQLQDRGFRRRRARRRPAARASTSPRHGRRRLHRAQHHRRGGGRPHRADRHAGRRRRQVQHLAR